MLAMIAAIAFGLALLLDWTKTSLGDALTPTTLVTIGLLLVALHLAGVGSSYNWRTRPRSRARVRR